LSSDDSPGRDEEVAVLLYSCGLETKRQYEDE